jgi:hypothetical protein
MSNYQMCAAVAVRLREGPRAKPPTAPAESAMPDDAEAEKDADTKGRDPRSRAPRRVTWKPPTDRAWWAMLERALRHPYDAHAEDLQRARKRQLPRFLYPSRDGLRTANDDDAEGKCLRDDYTISRFFRSGWFWQGLWEAGNRGRVVAEFEPEGSFGFAGEDDLFRKPNGDAGSYVAHIELAAMGVRRRIWLDQPDIYREARKATKGREDDLLEGSEAYISRMYRRFNLIDVPDEGLPEDEAGFGYPMPVDPGFAEGHRASEAIPRLHDGELMALRRKPQHYRRELPRVVIMGTNRDVWVAFTVGKKVKSRALTRLTVRELTQGTWTVASITDKP